jgi:hypothetical protein
MKVDLAATLEKVRSETPRFEDETESGYEVRTLHLAYMVIEHGEPVLMQETVEESEEEQDA